MRYNNYPRQYTPEPPTRRDPEVYRLIDATNKRVGFCAFLLGVGGYFLDKKVKELSASVKELEKNQKGE